MIRQRVSLAVAGTLVASTALAVGLAAPANAASPYDPTGYTPNTTDLVGSGSDTSEVALDFLSKGNAGVAGFNANKTSGRIASYAATPSENITLRDGTTILRPGNSGAGRSQLFGTSNNTNFDYARASSSIGTAEVAANLQQIPFAVDGLKLAVATTSNAPAAISAADMLKIYKGEITTWNQLTGNSAGSTATIKAYIPPTGSGTRSFFTTQLTNANGGNPVTLSGVTEAQEHDATVIAGNPNAIAPFSTGRAKSAPAIKLINGAGSLDAKRALFNVFRGADLSGPKKAIIDSAFRENGFICSPSARPLIEAAGFDQLASADNGGVCGIPVQANVSNFKLASQEGALATTTRLSASAANGGVVTLNAELSATGSTQKPVGKVSFRENGVQVAQANAAGGLATATISGVTPGVRTYTAVFVPTNDANFGPSQSALTSTNVLVSSGLSVSAASGTYGVARTITVNGSGGAANGVVSVNVAGVVSANVQLVNGSGSLSVPATAAVGGRAVTASFAGNASTFGSSASTSLSITKARSAATLKLNKKSIKAGKKAKATVTVKISGSALKATGKVTIKAGSKIIGKGTVKNGKATITLSKLKKGSYKVKAAFAGGGNYGASTTKAVKLKVTK